MGTGTHPGDVGNDIRGRASGHAGHQGHANGQPAF